MWEKSRIGEDKDLKEEYALRSMHELWRGKTILRKIRREARRIQSRKGANLEKSLEQLLLRVKTFLIRKQSVTLDEILSLETRDILERRLQTIVWKKHLARTCTQARQFITHGLVLVGGKKISAPSYLVKFSEEASVELSRPVKLGEEKAEKAERTGGRDGRARMHDRPPRAPPVAREKPVEKAEEEKKEASTSTEVVDNG
jgi:small subunit ribosomal protein S4